MTKKASAKPSPAALLRDIYAEIEVTPEKIRGFGTVMFIVLGLLIPGALYWRSGEPGALSITLISSGVLLGLVSRFRPGALYSIYRGWMSLALVLGLFMTKVIITLVFYGMMMPIGLARQLFTGDPLNMKPDSSRDTYWVKHDAAESDIKPERYEKQY